MEELKTEAEIDQEIIKNLQIMREQLGFDCEFCLIFLLLASF